MSKITWIIAGVVALLIMAILPTTCNRIDAGHVGIKVRYYVNPGVQGVTECTGMVWFNPFQSYIVEWPIFVQHVEYTGDQAFTITSKDGSEFKASPILNFSTKAEAVPTIYSKYRKEIEELKIGYIKTAIYEAFRISANSFRADSLVSNRELFEKEVKSKLILSLESEGFHIDQFTSGLEYPPTFKAAIEAKNTAIQTAMMAENQVKQAEANARIQEAKAEGIANSLIIQASAEAKANALKQQTLTPMLLQQQFIEKWNGTLPVYGQTPTLFKQLQ